MVFVECEVEQVDCLGPVEGLAEEDDARIPREGAGEVGVPVAARDLREVLV